MDYTDREDHFEALLQHELVVHLVVQNLFRKEILEDIY